MNAWRHLFLTNELNELQTQRLISSEFVLLAYGVLMEGFGLKYWITHDPELSTEANTSQSNFVLFFFVTTILIYGIGVTQYALQQIYGKITGGSST